MEAPLQHLLRPAAIREPAHLDVRANFAESFYLSRDIS